MVMKEHGTSNMRWLTDVFLMELCGREEEHKSDTNTIPVGRCIQCPHMEFHDGRINLEYDQEERRTKCDDCK